MDANDGNAMTMRVRKERSIVKGSGQSGNHRNGILKNLLLFCKNILQSA